MKFKDSEKRREFFLPKWERVQWTWEKWLLLAFAISAFVDSFFAPSYIDRGGDGMLFLILGFRAASTSEVPSAVVIGGGVLVALTLALNHGLLKSPSPIWTPVDIVLIIFVVFWGLRKAGGVPSSR